VRRVVLTHAHPDHVGSLDAVREKLPGIQLIISCRERRLYEGDFSLDAPVMAQMSPASQGEGQLLKHPLIL
jgi:glyoxylase-like metal-dependent hydrolase (beta-lactamase superfamily II)